MSENRRDWIQFDQSIYQLEVTLFAGPTLTILMDRDMKELP